jgi:hypothetical protein
MSEGHAKYSPSGAHRWMRCPGSLKAEEGLPDSSTIWADKGTVQHHVSAQCLEQNLEADAFTGVLYTPESGIGIQHDVLFDQDLAADAQTYIDQIRAASAGAERWIEWKVDFSALIQEIDQFGTVDAAIAHSRELQIRDAKFGVTPVSAEENEQLQIYALAALFDLERFGYEFERVRLAIHQPKVSEEPDEWVIEVAQLHDFLDRLREAVARTKAPDAPRIAGPKQCQWCKAKGMCPEYDAYTHAVVEYDRGNVTVAHPSSYDNQTLGEKGVMLDLVEAWIKAARAEIERRLLDGQVVPGHKLVRGKKGNRAWVDADQVEKLMKDSFRLKTDEMYERSLISPAAAEKLLKKASPKRWERLQELIGQADGKISVALISDKRPEYVPSDEVDSMFESLAAPVAHQSQE